MEFDEMQFIKCDGCKCLTCTNMCQNCFDCINASDSDEDCIDLHLDECKDYDFDS